MRPLPNTATLTRRARRQARQAPHARRSPPRSETPFDFSDNRRAADYVPNARDVFFSGDGLDADTRAELEDRFFCSLKLANGTYKQTCRGRLNDLDEFVEGLLPRERPLRLMDVAVSSGVTTAEWARRLERAGVEFQMTAGDAALKAFHLSIGRGPGVLLDADGHALQLGLRGRAVSTPIGPRVFLRNPFSITLARAAARLFFPSLRAALVRDPSRARAGLFGVELRPLDLVSRSLAECANVRVVEDDVRSCGGFGRSFHVVRAANILNRTYFDEASLSAILSNLRARLLPGGLLVVCRTDERGVNRATVFALDPLGGFEVAGRLNGGADVESLALELPA